MPVKQMLAEMDSLELTYWRALFGIKNQEMKAKSGR